MLEILSSEIVLGTITDVAEAIQWMKSTFFYVRIQSNPAHYHLSKTLTPEQLAASVSSPGLHRAAFQLAQRSLLTVLWVAGAASVRRCANEARQRQVRGHARPGRHDPGADADRARDVQVLPALLDGGGLPVSRCRCQ